MEPRGLDRVVGIIDAQADDILLGMRDGRAQAHAVQAQRVALGRVLEVYKRQAMISVRSFLFCFLPTDTEPVGVVVALAKRGVEEERWMPVFMYASLS